jgi:transcriptional regulator with XRE-family HTH domain
VNELISKIKETLQDEESRYVYTDTVTNAFVAAQIKALRGDRDLSQEELAELIGTKQSGVSRLENADYSAWKIGTLRKLARAFGVRLRIRFEEFGTLLEELGSFRQTNLLPRRFEQDPTFNPSMRMPRRRAQSPRKFRFSTKRRRVIGVRRRRVIADIPKKPQGTEGRLPTGVAKPGVEQPVPFSGYHPASGNNSTAAFPFRATSGNRSTAPLGGVYGN